VSKDYIVLILHKRKSAPREELTPHENATQAVG
jgi:hypothetical protein